MRTDILTRSIRRELIRSLWLQPYVVLIAMISTLKGRNEGFEPHEFERAFQGPWYHWWAAWVSIPAPED
jgi:hypothetical protein